MTDMTKKACFYCGRSIAVNPVTGNLRHHVWPKDKAPDSGWIIPGERCPGVGSGGKR